MPHETAVADLLRRHAVDELRSYRGNLTMAMSVVGEEWLPHLDDPGIHDLMRRLGDHLAESGEPEGDPWLLRFGLTVPGLQRGIVPPLRALDDNRGGLSPRRLSEAQGHIGRLRTALALGRRLIPGLSPDTGSALIELAALSRNDGAGGGSEWIDIYRGMPDALARQLAEAALELLDDEDESVVEAGTNILQRLACFRDPPLQTQTCLAALERAILWPSSLFLAADERVPCRVPLDERCSCGVRLSYLFDFSRLGDRRFHGVLSGAPRRVLHCPRCSMLEPFFTAYGGGLPTPYGNSGPEPADEEFPAPIPSERHLVSAPPFTCAEAFSINDASTLGGVPMWLQDTEYVRCPGCERLMVFLAQFDNGSAGEEGLYYSFFCDGCRIAAVSYHQT